MVRRLGIGATSAAVVLFSVILVSDLAVFSSSQGRAAMYSQADTENLLGAEGSALTGIVAVNVLSQAQAILSRQAFNCPAAQHHMVSLMASLGDSERLGPLTVTASALVVSGAAAVDNLSMVHPFNGTVGGFLGLALRVSERTDGSLGGVVLTRDVMHLVHLPLSWDALVRDCLGALSQVADAISASSISNCTSEAVAPIMAEARARPASQAAIDGFGFRFSYSILAQSSCTVGFSVAVEQANVEGPGGNFSVLLEGAGVESFA
jgi:hypothetical protein